MKNMTRTVVFYRRIIRTLVLCMVVAVCIKISLNPSVLKMAYAVDFRNRKSYNFAGNYSYGNPGRSTVRTYTLDMLRHTNRNTQETNWQTANRWQAANNLQTAGHLPTASNLRTDDNFQMTAAVARSTPTMSTRSITNHIKAVVTHTKNKQTLLIKPSNKSDTTIILKDLNLDTNSTKKRLQKHPNQVDFEMIASGRFIPEDLMKQGPFRFLNNYKNPCWKATKRYKTDPSIRCLPYFYLTGAPKSGTTDMHRRLIQHPDISRLVVKEPHWLTRKHYYAHGKAGGHSNLTDYLRYFTFATREIYMKEDGYHSKIFGDCSASTMWDNDYWTILPEYSNLSEPLYTNADYIYHLNPSTKIIAMLRNPVERLYSDYLFFQHGSPKLFHEGVIRLRIGVYHLHLEEYLRVFPRDQVMLIKLETFSNKTALYTQKIFSFLEITELEDKDLQKIANPKQHANTRRKKNKNAGEMLPETREMLQEFYRPHNELLTELLGENFNYNRDYR